MAKKQIILEQVPIHGIADRGKGVGRTADGLTVFVEGAVPGDVERFTVSLLGWEDKPFEVLSAVHMLGEGESGTVGVGVGWGFGDGCVGGFGAAGGRFNGR